MNKFHSSLGLGYTFMTFKASGIDSSNPDTSSSSQAESGINLNLAMVYGISDKLFAQVQYDFIKIGVDNKVPDITYNTNINILKIGLGYRL
ncbi:hypothetical protein [Changchengzhania lutea]|uniref:hypothetical protein n=1 Tax=Changchengzhania lutea TaxID=2049305 RepID=UPI00115EEE2B|nr:hypothetical protein [Changchengzhania lutea]